MNTLLTLAEVAITMAGFSAVVIIFKKRETGTWFKSDADRFQGMVTHAIIAALFCFLPFLVIEFVSTEAHALRSSSGLLCLSTAIQLTGAIRAEGIKNVWVTVAIVGVGGIIVTLLGINAIGSFPNYVLGFYLIGVFWHLVQASILFVMLIWVPASQIEGD